MNRWNDLVAQRLAAAQANFEAITKTCAPKIVEAAELLNAVIRGGHKILICGNGGSAADSQHMAAELIVRYAKNRKALSAMALTTDTSTLTACANDFAYEQIFSRQVEAFGRKGDALVAISTSGNSRNILVALEMARKQEMKIIGLTGKSGGKMAENSLCDVLIQIPSSDTPRIQEGHILSIHTICEIVENALT
jgi:D-sedoheptulose 7-phosphate isomerase